MGIKNTDLRQTRHLGSWIVELVSPVWARHKIDVNLYYNARTRFWIFSPLLTLIFVLIFILTLSILVKVEQSEQDNRTSSAIEITRDAVTQDLRTVYGDLRFIANSRNVATFLKNTGELKYRNAVEQGFLNIAATHSIYDQIRLLFVDGMELVRINYNNGVPEIVPTAQLQDKSDRYYFQDTQAIPEDKAYISQLDLNVEGGQIERPYKPMIRFATKVNSNDGQLLGVVVLNYLGSRLLSHFREHMEMLPGEGVLLNENGYWLSSPQPDKAWGFMFGREETFGQEFPRVWKKVLDQRNGVMDTAEGRFIFSTVEPLPSNIALAHIGEQSIHDWKIIVVRHREGLNIEFIGSHSNYFLPLFILYPLALVFLWNWCLASAGRHIAEVDLKKLNSTLEQQVKNRTAELQATKDATIMSLASLAGTRDNETGQHIRRTQNYIRVLAEDLESQEKYNELLDQKSVDLIVKSAPLHDIGKVGVPDTILHKPGRLSEEEFEVMKQHTVFGSDAIENAINSLSSSLNIDGTGTFLHYARDIAHYHHERWDGKGYPKGLIGQEIPFSARLMAIADVYDALVSERVYKPAFSKEKTEHIILQESEGQFDPDILDSFRRNKDKFWEISSQYKEP